MSFALVVAFLFFIGSLFGWILELFYRRFVSTKRWVNPGFLTGPYLPIYGFGLCLIFGISSIDLSFIENVIVRNILIMIFLGVSLTIIEFIAGLIFTKFLNVRLWDYSDQWGNIKGIICPLYTFFWCILGGIYYFFIEKHVINAIIWLSNNLAFSFIIGFFFGILTIDVSNSMNLVVKIKKFAKENEMLVRFEQFKVHIREEQEKRKEKNSFVFAFRSKTKLADSLREYKLKYLERK